MPRTRAAASSSAHGPRQNTLNFSGKITKPHVAADANKATTKAARLKEEKLLDHVGSATPSPVQAPKTVDLPPIEDAKDAEQKLPEPLPIRQQQQQQQQQQAASSAATAVTVAPPILLSKSKEDDEAAKVSEAQLKRYWKAKEAMRKFPRVHQEGVSLHDKILREFDLSNQYGPCVGIARTKRWKRASKLGLKPPIEVLSVLLKEDSKEKSQVDEIMDSRALA